MKIKVTQPVLNYDGSPIHTSDSGKEADKRPYIIRDAIVASLNSMTRDEVMTPDQRAKCYVITTKVYAHSEPDLTPTELAFIKERAGKILFPVHYGRLVDVIEPEPEKK